MYVAVECPFCKQKLPLETQQIHRGNMVDCPQCNNAIVVSGRFLSDIFWAANNVQREVSY